MKIDRVKRSRRMQELWSNPEYRKKMIAKQSQLGYRTYPIKDSEKGHEHDTMKERTKRRFYEGEMDWNR